MSDANPFETLSIPLTMAHDEATRCIQCGFCLPACPTYKVFGEEKHSPRGRIQLVKSWAEGNSAPDAGLLSALDLCLDCRACEIACPIDVKYGAILTGARDELADLAAGRSQPGTIGERDQHPAARDIGSPHPSPSVHPSSSSPKHGDPAAHSQPFRRPNRLQQFAFRSTLRHIAAVPKRMRFFARLGHRVLHSRFGRWLTAKFGTRPNSWFGASMTFAAALPAPATPSAFASPPSQSDVGIPSGASLFLGCAQEGMFPETNRATAVLLEEAGYDVHIPSEQGCCGALHRHHGDKPYSRKLAVRNLHAFGAFDENRDDPIVMNAGGCMAWIKEAAELFEPGTQERLAAQRMVSRVRDVSEVLATSEAVPEAAETARRTSTPDVTPSTTAADSDASAEKTPWPKAPGRVIYQPSCHLANVCGISEEPLALLQSLTDDDVQLPPDGGSCCGSAGIFNALHPVASKAILDAKMEGVTEADPDVIVTSNPGCHLQMLAGVQAHGLEGKVRVMQLADFVAEYGGRGGSPRG